MTRSADCDFIHFGIIVTGKGEEQALPELFRTLAATGMCHFTVVRRRSQRSPRQEHLAQIPTITGTQKRIPDRDLEEIGAPARGFLTGKSCNFVLLIDDLEHDRRPIAEQVYERYRRALDAALTQEQQGRAAVHFWVPMLEAYYFADTAAINSILNLTPPCDDAADDVELLRHPKGDLKQLMPGFDEVEHGVQILARLDLDHMLARHNTCAALRGLVAWCIAALRCHRLSACHDLETRFCLPNGILSPLAQNQIAMLPCVPPGK